MKTAEIIKNKVAQCYGLVEFSYNGKDGNIDPYYHGDGVYSYLLCFDGYENTVHSIESVMNTPFIDGKSLSELGNAIKILD